MDATVSGTVGRGVLAGLAGTAAMTAFQRWVEMPLTGRRESYEPAKLTEKLLPMVHPTRPKRRRQVNYAAHFGVGLGWGAAHGLLVHGLHLRGQLAVAAVFGALWPADVLGVAALGLHPWPWNWSAQDTMIDLADKLVLAQATGLVFDRLTAQRR